VSTTPRIRSSIVRTRTTRVYRGARGAPRKYPRDWDSRVIELPGPGCP
jgi:hypothetical protein